MEKDSEELDVDEMVAQSSDAIRLGVMKSGNTHERVGTRCVDKDQLWKKIIIAYFSGPLVYPNLHGDKDLDNTN